MMQYSYYGLSMYYLYTNQFFLLVMDMLLFKYHICGYVSDVTVIDELSSNYQIVTVIGICLMERIGHLQ